MSIGVLSVWTRALALGALVTMLGTAALAGGDVRTWSGGGTTNYWQDADNWVGGAAPVAGDSLVFPAVAFRRGNINDLATGTALGLITFAGDSYAISGNPVVLTDGISGAATGHGSSVINLDIELGQAQTFDASGSGIELSGGLDLNGFPLILNAVYGIALYGEVSGTGGITKNGAGLLNRLGNNSYHGTTQINAGNAFISHGSGLGASGAGNGTIVASGATLGLAITATTIPESITLSGTGVAGFQGALAMANCPTGCAVSGPVTLADDASIRLILSTDRLALTAPVGETGGAHTLTTTGSGTLILSAGGTHTGGTRITQASKLQVDGAIGDVVFADGCGTLSGSGVVASITDLDGCGTIAPGAGIGVLTVSGDARFHPYGSLDIELGGTTAGTQHDQLVVNGALDLAGARWRVSLTGGFVPVPGDQFTIIHSVGGVTGQFAQGTGFTGSGVDYVITYHPDSVVVTVAAVRPLPLTVIKAGSGSGSVTSSDGFIACGAGCAHDYGAGTDALAYLSANPAGSRFMGWQGACRGTGQCTVTMDAARTVTATFSATSNGTHILDIDANGQYDALTDGLMVIRYLFGLHPAAIVAGAVGSFAGRSNAAEIAAYLDDVRPYLDADGNGVADALTDGLLILRDLSGLSGAALINGARYDGPTVHGLFPARPDAGSIQNYLTTLKQ